MNGTQNFVFYGDLYKIWWNKSDEFDKMLVFDNN